MISESKLRDINERRKTGDYGSQLEAMFEQMYDVSQRLFVYGTLRPGEPNHHVLEPMGGQWVSASIQAGLVQLEQGIPGIHLNPNGARVPGFLLISDALCYEWSRLDKFEGQDYCRLLTIANMTNDTQEIVNVYALR